MSIVFIHKQIIIIVIIVIIPILLVLTRGINGQFKKRDSIILTLSYSLVLAKLVLSTD